MDTGFDGRESFFIWDRRRPPGHHHQSMLRTYENGNVSDVANITSKTMRLTATFATTMSEAEPPSLAVLRTIVLLAQYLRRVGDDL